MVAQFLQSDGVMFDVRSPKEYASGHIPGAVNLPLFTDEERADVGTTYKKQGKQPAISLGIKIVGPKLFAMSEQAKQLLGDGKNARVYCWRGGMRSGFVSWFLQFQGIHTITLPKGYKAFRRAVLAQFDHPYQLHVISGLTGVGKTERIQELIRSSQQGLDLEALANHYGSAFGLKPSTTQPTTEQFENLLACALMLLDPSKPIFVEDESRQIGSCTLPKAFFDQMKAAPISLLTATRPERVARILALYSSYPPDYLIECTRKLTKKLGSERTHTITQKIACNDLAGAVDLLLDYYDATYTFAFQRFRSNNS